MIIDALKKLADHLHLTEDEMTAAMNEIMEGACTDAQIACFLTALRLKGETADEITAAARVMRHKALSVPVKNRAGLIDIVGTGGRWSPYVQYFNSCGICGLWRRAESCQARKPFGFKQVGQRGCHGKVRCHH